MNRFFNSIVAALVILCSATVAHADNALTVFDGDKVSVYVPLPTAEYNTQGTRGQVIYPAQQLASMAGQPIKGITLYVNGEGCKMDGGALRISMGEVDSPVFSSTAFVTTGLTTVAVTELTAGLQEIDIDFETPYTYQGGHLIIDFYVMTGGVSQAYDFTYFYGLYQEGHTALTTGSEGNEYREFIPKTTFYYGETQPFSARVSPRWVEFNTVRAGESDLAAVTLKNNGLNSFTFSASVAAPFAATCSQSTLQPGESCNIELAFNPTAAGDFSDVLSIDCGEAGVIEVPLSGTALASGLEFTVCDAGATSSKLPFNGVYFSDAGTYGQMIYPAQMMSEISGTDIVALSFYTNKAIVLKDGMVQLSLKAVDQTEFATTDPVTDMQVVASMPLTRGVDVITFEFDEPFSYKGGNLVVEARIMDSKGNYGTTTFYGQAMDYNAGLSVTHSQWSGDSPELLKFLPKVTFTYQRNAHRGDVNNDQAVNITDVITLVSAISNGDMSGINTANADVDGSTVVNVSDVISLINFIISGQWAE